MNEQNRTLPKYTNHPVVEVALSVQFDKLIKLRNPQIGLLWNHFRERFPKIEEHTPLNTVFETFDKSVLQKPSIKFETFDAPPMPRIWFLKDDGNKLIQIQQDRFVHNWRKISTDNQYPHYDDIREGFQEEFINFQKFIGDEKIGEIVPNQCEVTYVNHIISGEGWDTHGQLDRVLTNLKPEYSDSFLQEPEDINLSCRYSIPNSDDPTGPPSGRLHVSCKPVFLIDGEKPMYLLELTARGKPIGNGFDGVLKFMDIGREWVVRGFTSITTESMHKIWRRKNVT